jgi:transketolase
MGMPVIPIIGQDGQVHYTRILYKAGTYIPFARIMDVYRRMSHIEVELLNRIANKYGLRAIDLFYVVTLGHLDATLDGPTHQATGEVSAFENSLPGSYAMLPTDYNETLAMLAHAASLSPLRPVGVVASREPWPVISLSARDPKLAAQGGYVLDDYQDREIGQRNSDHDNLLIMAAGGLIVDSLWKEVIPRLRQENSLNVRLAVGSSPYLFFNDRPNDAVEQSKAAVWNDGQITQTVAFAPVDPGFLSRFTLGNNSLWQTSFGVTQFGDTATAQQLNRMHGLDAETMYAKAVLFAQQRARREQLMRGA